MFFYGFIWEVGGSNGVGKDVRRSLGPVRLEVLFVVDVFEIEGFLLEISFRLRIVKGCREMM